MSLITLVITLIVVGVLSTCNGWRMAASASRTMSGGFTNGSTGLSRLTNASKEGLGEVDRFGSEDFPWSSSPNARPNTVHSGTAR